MAVEMSRIESAVLYTAPCERSDMALHGSKAQLSLLLHPSDEEEGSCDQSVIDVHDHNSTKPSCVAAIDPQETFIMQR